MFRSPRSASPRSSNKLRRLRFSAHLVRSIVFSSAMVTGTLAVSSALVACADDSQPEYWIEKLEDKAWRPKAIARLSQFFEDALTNNKKDLKAPAVQELLGKTIEPLTKAYVDDYQSLDEKTRESLINLLASFRDPRTEPALKKAFEEFGKRGRGGKDVKWASRAVRDMKLKGAAPAALAAFKKTKPSTKDGAYYRDLNEALLVLADASWSDELVGLLDSDFPQAKKGAKLTPDQVKDLKDNLYLVVTSAQILGEMKHAPAVKPLIKLILDPARNMAANEALLALTKIGKPSVSAAIKLLNGQDKELADYHKKRVQKANHLKAPPKGEIHKDATVMMIGAIGRQEGVAPLLAALDKAKEDTEKVGYLKALAMLPHTPAVTRAFMDGFKDLDKDTKLGGGNASTALAEAASLFFDESVTPALVKRANELKDDKASKSLIALSAIKTMGPSHVRSVGKLVKSLGEEKEGPMKKHLEKINKGYALSKGILDTCKKDVACYIKEASKTDNQSEKKQLAGIKAVIRAGQLGGAGVGPKLVEALPDLEKESLRYMAAQAIDHHNPKGNADIAEKLKTIVDKNKKSMDKNKASADKPLRDALYRMQSRAQ